MDIRLNGKCSVYGGGRGVDNVQYSVKKIVTCATLSSWWMLSSSVPMSRVRTRTGWPGVSTWCLGEVASLICNFYRGVAAQHLSKQIRP